LILSFNLLTEISKVVRCSVFAIFISVILSVLVANTSAALYFLLEDGQTRCFLEEVPKDTLVVGKYKTEEVGSRTISKVGIKLTATEPGGALALQRDLGPEGRFAFTSQLGGEYKICFQTNGSSWFGAKQKLNVHLEMETGVAATDYEEIAKTEHLTTLEISVRRLNDRIKDIRAEQNYQRNREITFRDTSESTNARVMWWSIIQTIILVGTGLWQITHLKNFFKTKKLV